MGFGRQLVLRRRGLAFLRNCSMANQYAFTLVSKTRGHGYGHYQLAFSLFEPGLRDGHIAARDIDAPCQ